VDVAPTTGTATCRAALTAGTRALRAAYAGDAYFGAATSGPLSERVNPAAPALSHVRLSSRRVTAGGGATLRLTLSMAASLHIQINRLVPGRTVQRRCRAGARHGARCTIRRRVRRSSVHGRRGANARHLTLRGLKPGRYAVAVTAVGAGGRRSGTKTVRFLIVRPRR
jgi:hypothetical protein